MTSSRVRRARPTRPRDAAACTAARFRQISQHALREAFSDRSRSHSVIGEACGVVDATEKSKQSLRMAGVRWGRKCVGISAGSIVANVRRLNLWWSAENFMGVAYLSCKELGMWRKNVVG